MWDGWKPENEGSAVVVGEADGWEEGPEGRTGKGCTKPYRGGKTTRAAPSEAESAEVDFTLALVTAGDTGDEQG